MTREEYARTQHQLILVVRMLNQLDLAEFLAWIDRAEALGPVLDPTLYRAGADRMRRIRRLAERAQALQQEWRECLQEEAGRR